MKASRRFPSYTIRNPHSYCFRMIVPKDLRKFVGKTELRYTLDTGSIGLAKSKARLLAGKFQQLFRFLRESQKLAELTNDQIQAMVNQYIQNSLKMLEERWLTGDDDDFFPPRDDSRGYIETLDIVKDDMVDELNACDYQRAEEMVNDLFGENGISGVQKDSYSYKKLCRELLKAEVKLVEIEKKQILGDYSDDPSTLLGKPPAKTDSPLIKKYSITLEKLIQEYKNRQIQSKKWSSNTDRNHQPKINTMLQVLGNRPVSEITVDDVRKLAQLLESLPPGFARMKEFKDISDLSPDDLDGKHDKTLDVTTRREYLNFARSVFTYAEENEYIKKNPVISGIIPPKKKNARGHKLAFDDPEDLAKIFNTDVFLGWSKDTPSRFWLPLLALYTGCRLEEIASLYCEDVFEHGDLHCIDINDNHDRKVKNQNAIRTVPLHPILAVELKFPEYVERVGLKVTLEFFLNSGW